MNNVYYDCITPGPNANLVIRDELNDILYSEIINPVAGGIVYTIVYNTTNNMYNASTSYLPTYYATAYSADGWLYYSAFLAPNDSSINSSIPYLPDIPVGTMATAKVYQAVDIQGIYPSEIAYAYSNVETFSISSYYTSAFIAQTGATTVSGGSLISVIGGFDGSTLYSCEFTVYREVNNSLVDQIIFWSDYAVPSTRSQLLCTIPIEINGYIVQYEDFIFLSNVNQTTTDSSVFIARSTDGMPLFPVVLPAQDGESSTDDTTKWIIIGISIGVGVALLAGVAFFMIRRRRATYQVIR